MAAYKKFNICIIVPAGNLHVKCFVEVALLLKHSFISLGYDCGVTLNDFDDSSMNIVLGANTLGAARKVPSSAPYILYQLEQLSEEEGWYSDDKLTLLTNAAAVWDYSVENIRFLNRHGIDAQYLPLGYHRHLEQIALSPQQDIDVLFFGSANERRKNVLETLREKGLRVRWLFGKYGRERDGFIARARINLNIHFYAAAIFEAVRISYLLNNRCFVLSEESASSPYENIPIPSVPYDGLVDACMRYCADPCLVQECADRMYAAFRERYPMEKLLKKVVGQSGV